MSVITLTAAQVAPVNETEYTPVTYIAGEALTRGQFFAIDTTTGKAYLADGSTGARNNARGIVIIGAGAGYPIQGLEDGSVYGFDLSGLAYDAAVYLSNTAGAADTAAGDVSVVLARVKPMSDSAITKVLDVNIRAIK